MRDPHASYSGDASALPSALVIRHLLAPLAYKAGIARFRSEFVRAAALAQWRDDSLSQALDVLGAAGVGVVLLKGISYAGALYEDPALRPMTDIDLLVQADHFARAAAALRQIGYQNVGRAHAQVPSHHAVPFRNADNTIDLHRTIIQPLRTNLDHTALWQRTQPAADRHGTARRFNHIDECLLHLCHIARHELRVALVSYVDAYRLYERLNDTQQQQLHHRARAYGVRRGINAALTMMRALHDKSDPGWRGFDRILPSPVQLASYAVVYRPIEIVRKLALVDGPLSACGLAYVHAREQLAHLRARVRGS